MTTTPSDDPQVPETPVTPPVAPPAPPAPSGYEAVPPVAPPAYTTPPVAPPVAPPGYTAPPAGGYQPPPGGYAAPPAPAYGAAPVGAPLSDSDQRLWATLAHILPIIGLSFVPPLVIWLVFKGRGQFVEEQAKEALNFQILLVIAAFAIGIIGTITLGIGFILYLAFIAALVFMIMAAIAANKGEAIVPASSLRPLEPEPPEAAQATEH
ncbi:MAG: DUF4870 domain-containing protein [Cellulomonadaceae bacterium]|nr:DUF4870 domain-containing protein [Cellulomonadaceae bacterium]